MSHGRKILRRIKTGPDREVQINRVRLGPTEVIEVRDFVPSLKRYGRGIVLSRDVFTRLIREEGPDILDSLWPTGAPSKEQEVLF